MGIHPRNVLLRGVAVTGRVAILLALGLRYQLANPEKTRGGFTQITEIMTRDPKVIPFGFILKDAGLKMRELDVGMLPISKDDRLVGMLTDRDITVRATA